MYIKVDKDNNVIEACSIKKEGYLDGDFAIDSSKIKFTKLVDGNICYDEKKMKKHIKNRDIFENLANELISLEDWFNTYDKVCNEHSRCTRLNMDCHHNMAEWDKLAIVKAQRIKEIKAKMNLD